MKNFISIGILALLTQLMYAQERSLTITQDRQEIRIGEQIKLQIELKTNASDTVVFPAIGDTIIKEIEVLEHGKIETSYDQDNISQRIMTQQLVVTSFDSGYYAIAPLMALVNGDSVLSNPFLIGVQTLAIDTAKGVYDIRDVAQVPFSLMEWLKENWGWVVATLVFIVLMVILIYWLQKKRRKKPIVKDIVPAKEAHVIALERLDELEKAQLWQAGKMKMYYSQLTEILREYLEARFMFPAMEQTSDEIVRSMKHVPEIAEAQTIAMKRLLFLADLVKFAKENPIGSENELHLMACRSFIQSTIIQNMERENQIQNDQTSSISS